MCVPSMTVQLQPFGLQSRTRKIAPHKNSCHTKVRNPCGPRLASSERPGPPPFEAMASAPELAKYHAAINAHGRKKQWAKALELLQGLDARLRANIVTYNAVINTVALHMSIAVGKVCGVGHVSHLSNI